MKDAATLAKSLKFTFSPEKSAGKPQRDCRDCGVPSRYVNASIEQVKNIQGIEIYQVLENYTCHYTGPFILAGGTGCGKTHASCAIINKFLEKRVSCRFVTIPMLAIEWDQERKNGTSFTNKFICPELLVLDDLGTRSPSEAFNDFLYTVIDERSNVPSCGTIITTNCSSEKMNELYGSRIVSRLTCGVILKMGNEDRRKIEF